MNLRNLPIKRKLTLALTFTSGVTLLLACGAFLAVELALFRREMTDSLVTRTRILAANTTGALAFRAPSDAEDVLDALRTDPRITAAVLIDRDGKLFATYPGDLAATAFPEAYGPGRHRFTQTHLHVAEPVMQGDSYLGMLHVQSDLSALRERLGLYGWIIASVIVGTLATVLTLASRLQRRLSRPILALAETARAVTERRDFSVRATAQGRDEIGQLTSAFNAMLTEIHQHASALEESEARFRNMADSIPQLAWLADAAGRISWLNKRWFEYTGLAADAGDGGWEVAIEPQERGGAAERWNRAITSREPLEMELRLRGADGRYRMFLVRAIPLKDAAGRIVQWLGTGTDIDALKQGEKRVRQFNAELEQRVRDRTVQLEAVNRELESFSYSVSHDLRAPLRHILGFVDLLKSSAGAALSAESTRFLQVITDSARQMAQLIDDLLVFSRMGRADLRFEPVDLTALLDEAIAGLDHETAGRNIIWRRDPLPTVQGDRTMLRQVLVNLVANAIKYTRPRDPAEIEIGAERTSEGGTVVHVRDNGVGFDMNYAGKLFGVFQRLHSDEIFEGTGIGLANVRRIITRHGGRTWAESRPDHGATFFFSLPERPLSS